VISWVVCLLRCKLETCLQQTAKQNRISANWQSILAMPSCVQCVINMGMRIGAGIGLPGSQSQDQQRTMHNSHRTERVHCPCGIVQPFFCRWHEKRKESKKEDTFLFLFSLSFSSPFLVTRRYISPICGAIVIKLACVLHRRTYNQNRQFCNKIFRGFRSTGGQNSRCPIDLLVIVIAGHIFHKSVTTNW